MDALSALRDFTIRGDLDKIVRVNDEFRLGNEYTFPCSTKTAYLSKQGSHYTLEALLYCIRNAGVKFTDYFQAAVALSIPTVTFIDYKPVQEYLSGKLSSTGSVVFPLPQESLNPNLNYRPDDPILLDSRVHDSGAAASGKLEDEFERPENYLSLIYAGERPLKDRESLLECKNRDFYGVLVASTRREEERQRFESQQRKDGLVAKSRLTGADERGIGYGGDELGYDSAPKLKLHLKGGKIGEGVPIILVPSAFQTLITIYNVKEFLEDGVFIPTDVKVKQMKGSKPECVTVQKKFSTDRNRVMTAYEVRDKPSALKADDWDRVVAVFVLGKEWQFKDWPFKDHVELFNKIVGFYMRFEDDSVESAKNVKQWNVKIISISKNKRHQDRAAALEVWDRLEEFVRSRSHT